MNRSGVSRLNRRIALLTTTAIIACGSAAVAAPVLPQGGSVAAGQASIGAPAGTTLTINQSSSRAVINWASFSVGQGDTVRFNQPNAASATLNRVTGTATSAIAGQILANGQVYLVNPNGIAITATGSVDVGGGFVASSLDIPDTDFMVGNLNFTGIGASASVANQGHIIAAPGGFAALIGGSVSNDGIIDAPLGEVALGSGEAATLDLNGDGFLQVALPTNAVTADGRALVDVTGQINAGHVELRAATALAALMDAVNVSGQISAQSASGSDGAIVLAAGSGGEVTLPGTLTGANIAVTGEDVTLTGALDASGMSGGQISIATGVLIQSGAIEAEGSAGAGGTISVTTGAAMLATTAATTRADGATAGGAVSLDGGGSLFSSGSISAGSSAGAGGRIEVSGGMVSLIGASLDASGATGGGAIQVGGDGGLIAGMTEASSVSISSATSLAADATQSGDGGHITAWSEATTAVSGAFSVQGGPAGGNGGTVDVSSRGQVGFGGTVSSNAPAGKAGALTLDPQFIVIENTPPQGLSYDLLDPLPAKGNTFGAMVQQTIGASGVDNFVITDPTNSAIAVDGGAVYLENAETGALISVLTGSHAGDAIGSHVEVGLAQPYAISWSPTWNSGRGAVTWIDITNGTSGVVSSANSLVGGTPGDAVGTDIDLLGSAGAGLQVLIGSPNWTNPANGAANAGAFTYVPNPAGITGVVGATNSLVGAATGDEVGGFTTGFTGGLDVGIFNFSGITSFADGDFYLLTPTWANGSVANASALTYFHSGVAVVGDLSAANSLVGSTSGDDIGSGGLKFSGDGAHFVVISPLWSNGAASSAGAVTWETTSAGAVGAVGAANSLVGSTKGDLVGSNTTNPLNGVTVSPNGSYYLVESPNWSNVAAAKAGAVTWASFATGVSGPVSASNSLVGSTANDAVGAASPVFLPNNNYLILDQTWDNTAAGAADAGFVSFGLAVGGVQGAASATNSLVGTSANDGVGYVEVLSNGAYIVDAPNWTNIAASAAGAGAVTLGSETTGVSGVITASNSVVGTHPGDGVGSEGAVSGGYRLSVADLGNGDYVISSPYWNDQEGAATWVNGATGQTMDGSGIVSSTNSLVGSDPGDVVSLNPFIQESGLGGFFQTAGSFSFGVVVLANHNYVIVSPRWNNEAGAVTWANGSTGIAGVVSAANSIVGSTPGDRVGQLQDPFTNTGDLGVGALPGSSNFIIDSPVWTNVAAGASQAGAITFVNGSTGATVNGSNVISAANSLVGTHANDVVGLDAEIQNISIISSTLATIFSATLANGEIEFSMPYWNGSAGAVSWLNPSNPSAFVGDVSASNSLIGAQANDSVGAGGLDTFYGGFYGVVSPAWINPATGAANAGAITIFNDTAPPIGVVGSANSIVGSHANDGIGGVGDSILDPQGSALANHVELIDPTWDDGRGAATFITFSGASWSTLDGQTTIDAGNSLIGSTPTVGSVTGDAIGTLARADNDGNYYIGSPTWNGDRGSFAFVNGATGLVGTVSSSNSLVGAQSGDMVGSGIFVGDFAPAGTIPTPTGNIIILSPDWANGTAADAGAATFAFRDQPITGVVSAANSFVGSNAGDMVGSGGVSNVLGVALVLSSPNLMANGLAGAGAVTPIDPTTGNAIDLSHIISTGNSTVGEAANAHLSYSAALFNEVGNNAPTDLRLLTHSADGQITVALTDPAQVATVDFALASNATMYIPPGVIANLLSSGTTVDLQANSDISLLASLTVPTGQDTAALTLDAGRSLILDASISTAGGALTLIANDTTADGVVDAWRAAGPATIAMAPGTSIDTGQADLTIDLMNGAGLTNSSSGAITLGSLSAGLITVENFGLTAGSDIELLAGANLSTVGPASGTTITLAADNGTFDNAAGADPLNPVSGSRYLIFADDPGLVTLDGLSPAKHLFSVSTAAFHGGTTGADATSDYILYRATPLLTVTADNQARTYGDPNPALTYTVSGFLAGDASSLTGSAATSTTATTTTPVGDAAITVTNGTLADSLGYGLKFVSGQLQIDPRSLTWSVADASATFGTLAVPGAVTLNGLVTGDNVAGTVGISQGGSVVTLTATTAAGAYAESVTGLTGAAASNYVLSATGDTIGTLSISKLTITALNWSVANATSTYGTLASLGAASLTGVLPADAGNVEGIVGVSQGGQTVTVTATTPVGTYDEAVTGLTGSAAGNYALAATGNTDGTLTIDPKALIWSVANASSIYGTLGAPGAASLTGIVSGDAVGGTVGVSQAGGAVTLAANTPAGAYSEAVTALMGASAANYILASTGDTAGILTINPKALTWSVADASSTYGTLATLGSAGLTGVVTGDTVSASVGASQSGSSVTLAANTPAGAYSETVTALTGASAADYSLSPTGDTAGTLTIDPKTLTWSVANASSIYGTQATPGLPSLAGVVAGDAVGGAVGVSEGGSTVVLAANTPAGAYSETVTALTGAAASNYSLASNGDTTGVLTISPKALTWSVANATSTFGTLPVTGAVALNGVVGSDGVAGSVELSQGGGEVTSSATLPAGSYVESVSALTGAAAGNYSLATAGDQPGTLTVTAGGPVVSVTLSLTGDPSVVLPGGWPGSFFIDLRLAGAVQPDCDPQTLAQDVKVGKSALIDSDGAACGRSSAPSPAPAAQGW